jgi:hypothetical protein
MRKNLMIALVAGTLCPAALAQTSDVMSGLPFGGEVRVSVRGMEGNGGYSGRAVQDVYDNLSNAFGNGSSVFLGSNNQILEDIRFTGSPWNNIPGRVITEMSWGVAVLTQPTNGTVESMFVVFWDEDDVIYDGYTGTGTQMIRSDATPIAAYLINPGVANAGFIYQFTLTLPGGGVAVPDDDNGVVVQAGWLSGTTAPAQWQNVTLREACPSANLRGLVFCTNSLAGAGGNPATVGSTTISYGRDMLTATRCPDAGIFIGEPIGTQEHRELPFAIGGIPRQLGYMIRLRGDVPPPPPPSGINVGCLNDGTTTVNNAGGSAVQWYEICLPGGAEDGLLQYLDIDTEGSASDVAIALFNSDSNVAGLSGTDQDDGSGTNAQLTFGVGRRAAVGDGLQYDGRDGQLPGGTYYLAVAPGGSTFGGGFTVNSAGTNGAFTVNFRTNVNGSPAGAFVTPLINGVNYSVDVPPGGPITFPLDLRPGVGLESGLRGVRWHTFELTDTAGSGDSYMDFDFSRLSTPSADAIALIFNSSGDIVFISDDEGDGLLPLFSWGAGTGPRTYPPGVSVYDGINGTISPGTYYVATALFPVQILPAAPDRFHVRGTSGSNLTVGFDIIAGGTPSGGSGCEPDFNQDGNVDQDDIACLSQVVAGDPSCSDQDPDFNGDGNVDQDDIDALAQVVAGSPCP